MNMPRNLVLGNRFAMNELIDPFIGSFTLTKNKQESLNSSSTHRVTRRSVCLVCFLVKCDDSKIRLEWIRIVDVLAKPLAIRDTIQTTGNEY